MASALPQDLKAVGSSQGYACVKYFYMHTDMVAK